MEKIKHEGDVEGKKGFYTVIENIKPGSGNKRPVF